MPAQFGGGMMPGMSLTAYATAYSSLKNGDVLHVGDTFNISAKSSLAGFGYNFYYLVPALNPYTLVRGNVSAYWNEDYEMYEAAVTESETGAYYFFKGKNGEYSAQVDPFEGTLYGLYSATGNSDGVSVKSIGNNSILFAVHEAVAVTGVGLNKSAATLTVDDEETLTATVEPNDASDKTVTWSSSNTAVATVDANGKVTAVSPGEAIITATATNGTDDTADDKTATCTVTVVKKAAKATYSQVGADYPKQFATDRQASLWKVTVTPGTDAITSLSVKVNEKTPDAPLSDTTLFSGKSEIIFGVVLNGVAADVQTFAALVNGEAVTTTAE